MAEDFQNVRRVLAEIGDSVRSAYRDNLISEDVNSTRKLYNNITVSVEEKGRFFIVSLNLEDYWKYIEYGRGPGKFPPIDEILNWITVKPVMARENDLGQIPSERSLAFLIARKIAREGTDPKPLLEQSVNEVLKVYLSQLQDALQTDIQNILYTDLSSQFTGFKHITFR